MGLVIQAYPRQRLGSPDFPYGEHWFVFAPYSYEPGHHAERPAAHYDAIAHRVVELKFCSRRYLVGH